MKRICAFLFAALLAAAAPVRAQSTEVASAIAEKQAEEERFKRLNSLLEDVQTAQTQQAAKLEEVSKKLAGLREEQVKHSEAYAPLDDLKKLAEAIQEVDRKREADNKLIREELAKIFKAIADSHAPAPPQKAKPSGDPKPPEVTDSDADGQPRKGYYYTIRDKDNLSIIVAAYREQGIKTSVEEIKKANPGLVPERMIVGKKIFIPQPKE